ncbi:MAG: hypothetical protein ABSG57_04820 [Candidatus Bathyarchaeia archaeon]
MTELLSLKEAPITFKMKLIQELGYESDGTYVLNKDGTRCLDRYTQEPIQLDNMVILPGSAIILDDNELSILCYLEEFGDVL